MTDKHTEKRTETHACDSIKRQDAIDAIFGRSHEIIKMRIGNLPSAQPDITDEQAIEHLQASGWMQSHDKQMYEMGLKERLADDSDSYDALLPSAQPDLSDYSDKLWRNAYERGKEEARIQKMQDLEQAEIQKAYELGKLDAMEEMPQWIPCSERLPEEETDVLVCNADGDINISRGSYSTEAKNEFIWYTSGWRFGKVIAWMPLPECYRGEEDG